MESLLTPGLFLAILLAGIGFIVWLVRLEGKVTTQATLSERLEKDFEKQDAELKCENEKLKKQIADHRENTNVHFDYRISKEVDKRNEQRFVTIELSLINISEKLDKVLSVKSNDE